MSHGFPRRLRKDRRKQKKEKGSRQLEAPVSPITGETEAAYQLPVRSDIKRVSTAQLIKEIESRLSFPQRGILVQALIDAEAQEKPLT